jgi:hypothetical protein
MRSAKRGKKLPPGVLRKCRYCGKEALLEVDLFMFKVGAGCLYGKSNVCKDCDSKNTGVKRKEPEEAKKAAKWAQDWRQRHPQRALLSHIRNRCKQSNTPFDLTLEDLVLPAFCPVLGIPLVSTSRGPKTPNTASVDRLIPHKGYVRDNVRIISMRANELKRDASREELAALLAYVNSSLGYSHERHYFCLPDEMG